MNETRFDATDDLFRQQARPILGKKRPILAFFAILGACWLGLVGYSRRTTTCAVCRMAGVDHAFLGLKWADQEETECSRWYRENVEPTHAHLWVRGPHCRRFGIPGLYGGFACSMGNPIAGLSMTTQMELYRHFENRLEAKQLFLDVGRMEGGSYGKLQSLMEWVNEGYPGPWDEWWESHRVDVEG